MNRGNEKYALRGSADAIAFIKYNLPGICVVPKHKEVRTVNSGKVLKRERIETELDHIFDYPLTIVSATMGYGKTTAVRMYLDKRNIQTIWISLLGSDGDETVFWHKLSRAVGRLYPKTGGQLDLSGFPVNARQLASVIDLFWELDDGAPAALVLDDYHAIEQNTQVVRLLEQLVREEIPGLHIVLISRTWPKINRIDLLSKGLCFELDTGTLAFTQREVQEYCSYMDFSATSVEIEKIHRLTGGWISAIYLLLLGLKRGLPVADISDINRLVRVNLFDNLDRQTQEILLGLSIFDSFTLDQAAEVLDNSQTAKIVEGLLEQNAFVEYDRSAGAYRLHNVLSNFLRQKLKAEGIDLNLILRRAGKWHIDHGEFIPAFDCYHRAGSLEELLAQINHPDIGNISYFGYRRLEEICSELSPDLCVRYPFPFLQIALDFIISGEEAIVAQGVEIAGRLREFYEKAPGLPPGLRSRILGELKLLDLFLVFNDAEMMASKAQEAQELLEGDVSCLVYRHNEFTFGLPHFLYEYYREPGKLKDFLNTIVNNFPPPVIDGCGTGCGFVALSEYALEQGDLETAELNAYKAIYKARTKDQYPIMLCAQFTLMRLKAAHGRFADAVEMLRVMKEIVAQWGEQAKLYQVNYAIYNMTLDLSEGYLYGCLEMPEMIPEWLRTGEMDPKDFMLQGMGFPCIVYGKAVLLSGNWAELEILCEAFEEKYALFHNQLGLLHNAIYRAVARMKLYGIEAGLAALLPALIEAQMDGILLPFAENAGYLLPMLEKLWGTSELDSLYLEKLTALCRQYSENLKNVRPSPSILTQRETQVLALLAQGLTQRQIASRLYLSVSGVKRHLENIYCKLGVNNKISAVQKAREAKIV